MKTEVCRNVSIGLQAYKVGGSSGSKYFICHHLGNPLYTGIPKGLVADGSKKVINHFAEKKKYKRGFIFYLSQRIVREKSKPQTNKQLVTLSTAEQEPRVNQRQEK